MHSPCRPSRTTERCVTVRSAPSRRRGLPWLLVVALLAPWASGCAALTNPVSRGIPPKRLDPKFLAKSREEQVPLPLNLLQRRQDEKERILPGAIVGVFIDNVLGGTKDSPPPVQAASEGSKLPPSIGYPVVVRDDGTISLPYVDPIDVKGLTAAEAEKKVRQTLLDKGVITPQNRCIVTLQRQNSNRILVVRQDSGGVTFGSDGLNNTKRGTGYSLDLPESESDIATALTRTGGLPGLDAFNEVFVVRPLEGRGEKFPTVMPDLKGIARDPTGGAAKEFGYSLIRIPLRMKPGEPLNFTQKDVVLRTGDIVYIEARDAELFYTGGIIPPKQYVLPRDYDLDVLEAMALVGAPFFNGAIGSNNFTGNFIQPGLGQPSPTDLAIIRRIPNVGEIVIRVDLAVATRDPRERVIIMPGDVLILQETLGEAFVRYVTQITSLGGFFQILQTPSAQITGSARFP